jgi:general secretion pathway protein C
MINFETELRRRFITAMLLTTALLCAGYWVRAGLSAEKKQAVATVPTLVPVVAGTATELARLLGAPRPALAGPALSPTERFRVYGVIASASGQGTALVSVDKQPPRPFSVGSGIAPGFVLKSVTQREVRLSDSMQGAVTAVLPLPDPTKVKGDVPSNNLEALVLVPPEPLQNSAEPEAGPPSQPNMRGPPSTP